MELPLDITELILSHDKELIKIGGTLNRDLYKRLAIKAGKNDINVPEFTKFMYTTPRTILMFKYPIIYPEWLLTWKWIAEWDIYTFNPQASRQHYMNNRYRLSPNELNNIHITQHTLKPKNHPIEFPPKPFVCVKFVPDIINTYKEGNILFDALTYYRIMSERLCCQKIDSNYAKSETQKYFNDILQKFKNDTSTDLLRLFIYLMGNVETFNLNIPMYHIYYDTTRNEYILWSKGAENKTITKKYNTESFVQFCINLENKITCEINRFP